MHFLHETHHSLPGSGTPDGTSALHSGALGNGEINNKQCEEAKNGAPRNWRKSTLVYTQELKQEGGVTPGSASAGGLRMGGGGLEICTAPNMSARDRESTLSVDLGVTNTFE